ncbi:unnamed protein product [Bursaphelenchus xylophilus]|uniref:(pine wood nematode) hypothetical protein n=1 Tax=Bursaphelenchus xylophilus TaxID=6326 RepID=A0A1I7S614_BURXY|nr:unnamed protein product [Bursaphelenchus xylophilus]CAG9082398.1 unnamed protein product [Bursaphelenchus xylophilus]
MSSTNCESSRKRKHVEVQVQVLKERVNRHPEASNEYFGNPKLSDFRIQAGDKTFHVVKYVLALKSKVFARMLLVDMKETTENFMTLDEDPEVVEAMLKFLYMNTKVKGNELARKVVQLAHRYEISELKEQCELEILETLTVEDAAECWLLASKLKLPRAFLKCNQFLYENFEDFDEHLISLCPESIELSSCLSGHMSAKLTINNDSDMEIAFKLYTVEPLTSRMNFKVVGPNEELELPAGTIVLPSSTGTGLVCYAPYTNEPVDYNQLHLLPNARFITVEILKRKMGGS